MAEGRRVRCNHCMSVFDEEYLKKGIDDRGDFYESCPVCSKRDALMDTVVSDDMIGGKEIGFYVQARLRQYTSGVIIRKIRMEDIGESTILCTDLFLNKLRSKDILPGKRLVTFIATKKELEDFCGFLMDTVQSCTFEASSFKTSK